MTGCAAGLGVVGHVLYQICFIGGLARTSVANSSLIIAATPVLIALVSAALGDERTRPAPLDRRGGVRVRHLPCRRARHRARRRSGCVGDLMVLGAVCCWAIYTLGARPLMARHSPVAVTGLSMAIGALLYVPVMWPRFAPWTGRGSRHGRLASCMYSALFGLCLAYTIWYVGSARSAARGPRSTRTSIPAGRDE